MAASALPEQFRTASRLTGLAIGGTVATPIFGGLAPYRTQLAVASSGWALAPGILIAVVALATIPAIRSSPQTAYLPAGGSTTTGMVAPYRSAEGER